MTHSLGIVGLTLALLPIAGHLGVENASAKEILRWKFQPGQELQVVWSYSVTHIIEAEAVHKKTEEEFVADWLLVVESVGSGGTAEVTATLQRGRLSIHSPDDNMNIDTARAADDVPHGADYFGRKMLVGFKIHFTIDNRGRVLRANADKKAREELSSKWPSLSDRLSEKGLTQTLRLLFPVLPDAALEVGDTWNDTIEYNRTPGTGFDKARCKFRYTGPTLRDNRTVEKIVVERILEWGGEKPHGIAVTVVSQDNPGTIYFDNRAGHLESCEDTEKRTVEYSKNGRTAQQSTSGTFKIEIRTENGAGPTKKQ